MNTNDRPRGEANDDTDAKAELAAFFAAAAAANAEQDAFGRHAPAAMLRLARACYGHDNSQAQTVAAALASIYNGTAARPVRLDEIRWLDWSLQRDLVTVMIGTGRAGFEDVEIRKAFFAVGGAAAVEWFHWFTIGGPHRAALGRIVRFIAEDSHCSTAGTLRNMLRAIYNGTTVLSVSKLTYVGDLGPAVALVLEGIIGRDSGIIRENDIEAAFRDAGISEALTEDVWPKAKAERS